MAKEFRLRWVYETFADHPGFFTKRMFGGLAVYVHDRMVMVLTETEGERTWKDQDYPFDIWNGVLLPTDRHHHESLVKEFGSLQPHPVLGKWLYLPISAADFEEVAASMADLIAINDGRFGISSRAGMKKSGKGKKKKAAKTSGRVIAKRKKRLRISAGKKFRKKNRKDR